MLREERADIRNLRIHLALHITRRRIAAIPENALVVHEAARILPAEILAHLIEVAAAVSAFSKKGHLITLMEQPSQTSYYLLILFQVSSSFATIRACSASVSVTFAR